MRSFIIGVLMMGIGAYIALPFDWALGWTEETLAVLKGITPIALVAFGGVAILLGLADIRDRADARKETQSK